MFEVASNNSVGGNAEFLFTKYLSTDWEEGVRLLAIDTFLQLRRWFTTWVGARIYELEVSNTADVRHGLYPLPS